MLKNNTLPQENDGIFTIVEIIIPDAILGYPMNRKSVESILVEHGGGWSEYAGHGAWLDSNGDVVREYHTKYEVAIPYDLEIRDTADELINMLSDILFSHGESSMYFKIDGMPVFKENPVNA